MMRKFLYSGVVLALLATQALARADDVTMRPYLGESLSYTFSDSTRHADGGIGGYVGGGIPLNRLMNVEVGGGYTHFNADKSAGSNPWQEYLAKVDGQFFFSRDPDFSPYLALGLGYAKEVLKNTGDSSGAFMADPGFGAIHYFKLFNTDFGVRGDFRYRFVDAKSSKFPGKGVDGFGEPVLSLGLVVPLSFGETPATPEPVVLPPPLPPPPPPPAPVCHPPAGFKVDANCHIIEQSVIVRTVEFEFNSARLTAPAQATLDEVASAFAAQPELNVEIQGHTDSIGSAAYNKKLSQKRADAVKAYLVSKGVNASSLTAKGFGKTKPIASNKTVEGRAQNRRVEFEVTNAPAHLKVINKGATAASTAAAEQGAQPKGLKKAGKHHHQKKKAAPATDK